MSKELKNKIDSIRRTLKNKELEVAGTVVELKILELCPNFPDDWCPDTRTEIINALVKELQPQDTIRAIAYPEEPETLTEQEEERSAIAPVEKDENTIAAGVIAPTDNQALVISDTDKQALVTTQSQALGFNLSEEETTAIADTIDDVFTDYSSFISSVTTAIKGYIANKFDALEDEIEADSNDVRNYLSNRTKRLNEKVADYAHSVRDIKTDTEVIRQQLKTSHGSILSRFRTS